MDSNNTMFSTDASSTGMRPANSPINKVQNIQIIPDARVKIILKSLQIYLKAAQDKSPKSVIAFLKTQGLTDKKQIKYFLYKANILTYNAINPESWESKQQKSAAFQNLPAWMRWGMSKTGHNPTISTNIS